MIFCVGLTGNIASGKSLVASLFAEKGIEIINADQIARDLTDPSSLVYQKIVEHFGPIIVLSNNELDRRKLRNIIFSNKEERKWLENLLHPLIREKITQLTEHVQSPYCIVEIPLLRNKQHYPYLNRILAVISSHALQVERLMKRDHCSKEEADLILATQPSIEERKIIADDLIWNDGSISMLKREVETLHKRYSLKRPSSNNN